MAGKAPQPEYLTSTSRSSEVASRFSASTSFSRRIASRFAETFSLGVPIPKSCRAVMRKSRASVGGGSGGHRVPTLLSMAQDVGFGRLLLCLQAIERLLQPFFGRLARVDRAPHDWR